MSPRPIPTPSLVVLVGAPASGKSTWAAENFRPEQVVSADALRGIVGEHELDLAATDDAFDLLDRIVAARLGRGLTTVIDTTGLDPARRAVALTAARSASVSAVAVRFTTSAAECKRRNRERAHPVPVRALDQMIKKAREVDLGSEGWDLVIEPEPVRTVTRRLAEAVRDEALGEPTPGLRFGLLVSSFDWGGGNDGIADHLVRIARDAEAAGFDSIWVMDHLIQIPQVGRAWDPMLESYSTLAHIAAVTQRIRLGVLVSPVTTRPVGLLAKQIATLDVLSGGRVIVGLGAGNSEHEHRALGIPFGSVSERMRLLADTVGALRSLLGPGGKPFTGEVLSLPETGLYPRPLHARVPIIVGGSGERVTLRIAAQLADGCNLFGDAATVRRKVEVLREHCAAVGRDVGEVEVTHLGTVLVGADADDVRVRVDRLRPPDVGPERYADRVGAGTVDDHEAGFRALAVAGVSTAIVSLPDVAEPGALEAFGSLIHRFGGDAL
ncbi:MAG: LLM class flavin-dependent oxidoreductase [Ilumatobacter sp.]